MKSSRALDFDFDEGEAAAAKRVLVPLLLTIVGTTLGIGAAKACCGVSYRKFDPHGVLPIGMALLTSGIAVWSYLNPTPERLVAEVRHRVCKVQDKVAGRQSL